jgi:hypothetical protein
VLTGWLYHNDLTWDSHRYGKIAARYILKNHKGFSPGERERMGSGQPVAVELAGHYNLV